MFDNSENTEFSHVVNTGDVPPTGRGFALEATPKQCHALCSRFDLIELKQFQVSGQIKPQGKRRFVLAATLVTEFEQECIITLEPISNKMTQSFELELVQEIEIDVNKNDDELLLDPYEDEPPLIITNERIDIGECAVQYFTDCLDVYPRKPDAEFKDKTLDQNLKEEEKRDNPFKVLQKLKP